MPKEKTGQSNTVDREPVVCVLGHIDHGKSSLLDYIRKTNITEKEAGGITQCISACEVEHKSPDGSSRKITFLDTPGHEAFRKMRRRGAKVADIAVLVVSAEDGVKPQTKEAYESVKEAGIPFVVAITKIDKPNADINRTKTSLAENEIYLEGFGGNISFVPVSSKTGEGVNDLLELVTLTADVTGIKGDANKPAEGFIVESQRDPRKGVHATLIVREGKLETGMYVVCGQSLAPVRILEDMNGKPIKSVVCGSPVRLSGWSSTPDAGGYFKSYASKKLAEEALEENKLASLNKDKKAGETKEDKKIVPLVIKADSLGSIEAIIHELDKISHERITTKIIYSGVGDISESDVKMLAGASDPLVLGFNVKVDAQAKAVAERQNIKIEISNIIYELAKWLEKFIKESAPKIKVEEVLGEAKIMKFFSKTKDKQIIGGKVISGKIAIGHKIKIKRRENVLGDGLIRELQQQKERTSEVPEGFEFGSMIESKIEIAPGDIISDFIVVEKQ